MLLGLRESLSEDLGWGFQLQEPVFVFVLAVFLLIFAMSLSGVFEIGMSITGVGAKLTQSVAILFFFSGVLATVVDPLQAPFSGLLVQPLPWNGCPLSLFYFGGSGTFISLPAFIDISQVDE